MSEPTSKTPPLSRRDANQLERLFDLLPDDSYDVVAKLPYASRVQIERWYAHEADRLEPVMGKMVAGVQHCTPAITELLDLAASEPVDLQGVGKWLSAHREELSAQLLTELVSAAMGRGVVNLMSARGQTKRKNTTTKLQKLGVRWLELHAAGKNKSQAAEVIAKEMSMAYGTVYNHLSGDVDANERIFPEGVNAARKTLGLLPS